jgi:dipeptidyl aminopeptidase/acylaminoacyl peptidase
MLVKSIALCAAASLAALPAIAASPVEPADLYRIAQVEDPVVSPGGDRVAFIRTRFDIGTDRRVRDLWLARLEGARIADLRLLAPGIGSAAVWSPDGTRIAYVAPLAGKPQLHVLIVADGIGRAVTVGKAAPTRPVWSPDGTTIAFAARIEAEPVKPKGMPAKPEGASWAPDATVIDSFTWRTNEGGQLKPGFQHLFTVPAAGGPVSQVTQGDLDHVEANGAFTWSAQGDALIVASNRRSDRNLRPRDLDLWRVPLKGAATAITTRDGGERDPTLSPDGRTIAFIGTAPTQTFYVQEDLWIVDSAGGTPRNLTVTFDRPVEAPHWTADGRAILALFNEEGVQRIGRFPLSGGAPEVLARAVGGTRLYLPSAGGGFDAAGGTIAYTSAHQDRPAGLAVQRGRATDSFDPNAAWRAGKAIGRMEEVRYRSKDGRPMQGWVLYPHDFDATKRYPLILDIHGGPNTDYGPFFSITHALYAARGYIVLFTNPRGSIGYGADFANFFGRGYPSEDHDDLIAGVDTLTARPYVDARNVFIGGGSGGGLLTLWAIGREPDKFRAAVSLRPVADWSIQALSSDLPALTLRYWIGGTPWSDPQTYFQRSPISLVGAVKTPVMLITGETDFRTPMAQTETYYQALKLRGVDAAMVRLPEANHGMGRPSQWLQSILLPLDWFDRYRVR